MWEVYDEDNNFEAAFNTLDEAYEYLNDLNYDGIDTSNYYIK